MIQQTQQQRDNTLIGLRRWAEVDPATVVRGLSVYRDDDLNCSMCQPPSCGSPACFGGHVPYFPEFAAQGVYVAPSGAPEHEGTIYPDSLLFGDYNMFDPRNCHPADVGFRGTDHELVTNRLNWLLANSEVISS